MNHTDDEEIDKLAGQFSKTRVSKTRVSKTKNDVKSFISKNGLSLNAVKIWENFKGDSTAIDTFLKQKKAEQVESRKPKPFDRRIFDGIVSKSSGIHKGGYHKSRRSSHKRVLRHSKKQKRVRHTRRKQTRRHRHTRRR